MQVTHEEMGKRKCKLQKGRDKPMEPENARRLEEKARKAPTSGKGEKKVSKEQWADFSKKMTEMEVAYYKPIAEQDYEHHMIKEDLMHLYPGGPDAARAMNANVSKHARNLKEYAAACVKEYEEKGYIEGFPECRFDSDFLKLVDTGI
jgi:hypothetical protein